MQGQLSEIIERISKVEQKVSHQTDRINQLDKHQHALINHIDNTDNTLHALGTILHTKLGKIVLADTVMIILTTILNVIRITTTV